MAIVYSVGGGGGASTVFVVDPLLPMVTNCLLGCSANSTAVGCWFWGKKGAGGTGGGGTPINGGGGGGGGGEFTYCGGGGGGGGGAIDVGEITFDGPKDGLRPQQHTRKPTSLGWL